MPKGKKDPNAPSDWRAILEQAQLDDDKFKVKVVVMEAAGSDQDVMYLAKFETCATEERRSVIKNICRHETIYMVNQLGGEKPEKDASLRVFEEGFSYLNEKKDIPPDVQALIIKYIILKMKDEYLIMRRQKLELLEGLRRESATMLNKAEVKGTVCVKPPESEVTLPTPKQSGKKGKAVDTSNLPPEPEEGKKYNTPLRVRGEEWRDKLYVEDFPLDGPNLYVAITGFLEPELLICLVKLGIPLTAVVQLRINPGSTEAPSSVTVKHSKRGQPPAEPLTEKSHRFWENVEKLRLNKETTDNLKNTAFIVFYPPYWKSENLSDEVDKIYDELCYLMYDVQDLSRQHLHYLDNLEVIPVPEEAEEYSFNKYYHQLIDDLPLECVTIYSILDSLLQAVTKYPDFSDTSRTSLSAACTLNQPKTVSDKKEGMGEKLVKEVFDNFCQSEAERKSYRLTYGEEYENHKDPIVIKYGDFSKYSTFHLGNINLENIVGASLFGMPVNKLWHNIPIPDGPHEAKINFHVNVLLSCFDRQDVETAELDRLLHILAFRKLYNNRSSLKKHHIQPSTINEFKKNYLKRSILAEPLSGCPSQVRHISNTGSHSFPSIRKSADSSQHSVNIDLDSSDENSKIKFLFDCPDISELLSAAEIAIQLPISHMIDDFEYFEDFTGISAFQILLDAYNNSNCLDYKYCEVTDSILLMFFNSHDKEGISREEWRCHLATPLCLQDFFDFVLDERYEWIKNEELLYDERMGLKPPSEMQENVEFMAVSCLDDMDIDADLLMDGSLKHQEILKELEAAAAAAAASEPLITDKKTVAHPSSVDVDAKSPRKTKSSVSTATKKSASNIIPIETMEDLIQKPFFGYDLGERRVEVFGKDVTYFSRDGTRISSAYTLLIPYNLEYIILNVVPGNGQNEFWIHKAFGDYITPDLQRKCESFRVTSKNQVMMNIIKRSYEVPLPVVIDNNSEHVESSSVTLSPRPTEYETKYYYSLYVTWPNGLFTETIYETNTSDISHIKQYYQTPLPDLEEYMRCISWNGEVIIFKNSGEIEVLQPNGTYIKIIKCERKPVTTDDDMRSDLSSGKLNRRNKSKSKVGAKDDVEDKPIQYEVLYDFEIIESNGLRQSWINNIPYDIEKLLIRTATDYCLGEVFSRRMDGTNTLYNKDGIQIVTFPDKTRIISEIIIEDYEIYAEWTDEEKELFQINTIEIVESDGTKSKSSASSTSGIVEEEEIKMSAKEEGYLSIRLMYTIEHVNFTTVVINQANNNISINSPNNTCVTLDTDNHYEIILDDLTKAFFNGEVLHVDYEACTKCKSITNCDIMFTHKDALTENESDLMSKNEPIWLKMKDSFSNNIVVNDEGAIYLVNDRQSQEPNPPEVVVSVTKPTQHNEYTSDYPEEKSDFADDKHDVKSESSYASHVKCKRDKYDAKTVRFFALRRDLTCSELVHNILVAQYKDDCRWQPWCSIGVYDTFGDNRLLVSVLTPIIHNQSEKWLMNSKLIDKPDNLTYKDLKKDCGKGFYHWMRPYERFEPKVSKPENVLPPRLPRAFVLRTLERQWNETARDELKGASELLAALLRYRRMMESDSETLLKVPILDLRLEEERRADDLVQALGHRIYNDLKERLRRDVESRAKATITTKPRPPSEEMSAEGESTEVDYATAADMLAEELANDLRDAEAIEEMSSPLQRYWKRRAEELKEEEMNRYLLREDSIPPYFENILGGSIWWDVNNMAGEAPAASERRRMICSCHEATASTDSTPPPNAYNFL